MCRPNDLYLFAFLPQERILTFFYFLTHNCLVLAFSKKELCLFFDFFFFCHYHAIKHFNQIDCITGLQPLNGAQSGEGISLTSHVSRVGDNKCPLKRTLKMFLSITHLARAYSWLKSKTIQYSIKRKP